jgi:PAS domain S-box-containing protein
MIGPQPVKADGHIPDGDEMPKSSLRSALRYGIAPMSVALATAIRLALDPLLGDRFPFLAFIVAIGVTTWYGGLGPSLLAVALSWLAADHFLLHPRGSGPVLWDRSQVIVPFFVAGLIVTLLTEAVRDARSRAGVSAAEARRADEARQAQREWHRITLASIGDAVITIDPGGRVTSLNPAAVRLTDSGGQEAVGRRLTEVVRTVEGAIDGTAHLLVAGVVRGEAVPSGHPTVLIDGGGTMKYVEHNAAPIRDDKGEVTGVVIVLRDVTERRQAEQALRVSEERFARFMQHLPGLAWIKDEQGRYVYANDAAVRAFRHPRGDLYGRTDEEVFPAETAARFRENDRRALASEAGVQVVETLEHEDGIIHHSIASKFPIPGRGDRPGFVGGVAIDITDLKRAEAALRDADRRKDEFLAMLAHELRNPLAPIRNAVTVMAMSEDDRDTQRWSGEVIDRQVRHLSSLVDDLLDVSRITQGKITLTKAPLAVSSFVHAAVESSRPLIDARKHALEVKLTDEPLRVDGDLTRLAQVVLNLLNNAAKYTPEGGHIRLSSGRDGDRCRISVRDDGEGITPETLPTIFDLFTQANRSLDRSQGGLGVGLTLVRRLVEMHGGTVEAHSDGPGEGSEFVVRLPLLREGAATPVVDRPAGGPAGGSGRSRRILIVDDSPDTRASLARLMKRLGHEVEVAPDGIAAVQAAIRYTPDLVLLDIGLPGMDGYEVARRLKLEPSLHGICLVALTGYGSESDRQRSTEVGFDDHLVKPVEFDALLRALERAQVGML